MAPPPESILARAWHMAHEAVFPTRCLVCRQEGDVLCETHRVFSPAPDTFYDLPPLRAVFSAVEYDERAKQLIEHCKFYGLRLATDLMAQEIAHQCAHHLREEVILMPIPLHWTRWGSRSFNQSARIAQHLSRLVPGATYTHALRRTRATPHQSRLTRQQRLTNVEDAFVYTGTPDILTRPLVLVDDVIATGSTLHNAAKALEAAGAKDIRGCSFAGAGG